MLWQVGLILLLVQLGIAAGMVAMQASGASCDDGILNQGEDEIDCGGPRCDPCFSCHDSVKNQGETGIDCGGPNCDPCPPSCSDGMHNGNEDDVDCGGSCPACPTCTDGVRNGAETGIDCGGTCGACPTCTDGIQNQGEGGIDCGGPCGEACTQITAYFVSSSTGDDGNSGTSMENPWKTIARLSSVALQPGNRVLFRRGDTWNETLFIRGSGASGEPIYIRPYGSGARPVIDGGPENLTAGIHAAGMKHVAIENIEVRNVWTGIELGGFPATEAVMQEVTDCRIHDIKGTGSAINGTGGNITIDDNDIFSVGGSAMRLSGRGIEITDNDISLTGLSDASLHAILLENECEGYRVAGNVINKTDGSGSGGAFLCTDAGFTGGVFENNTVYSGKGDGFGFSSPGPGATVRYNAFFGAGAESPDAVKANGSGLFHHNLIKYYANGFFVENRGAGIHNNIILSGGTGFNGTGSANFTFHNNIVADCGAMYGYSDSAALNAANYSYSHRVDSSSILEDFVDFAGGNYRLLSNATVFLDEGVNVGIAKDFYGNSIPQGAAPDAGLHEVPGGRCVRNCSCNTTTCMGGACDDGCGGTCAGTLTLAADCGERACGTSPHACGICGGTLDCGGGINFCNTTTGACQQSTCTPDCGARVCGMSPNGCGSCGLCSAFNCISNVCNDGACIPACSTGFGDCDGNGTNGCETNINTTDGSCGACGYACSADQHCDAGDCACDDTDMGNCDGSDANGCETDLLANGTHCGACNNPCTGGLVCQDGDCVTAACPGGTDECVPGGPVCETNILTNTSHCGACGNACSTNHATPNCTGGTCGIASCSTGFGDCNGNASDGCETSTTTTTNCGSCGNACSSVHGTAGCSGTACTIACDPGWGDCTSMPGCETDTKTNSSHCGSCGSACGTGQNCINSQCLDVTWRADLISWWTFDGNASDHENNNPGTVYGPLLRPSSGRWGSGAYEFDGVDDYIDVGTFSVSGGDLTLAAWVTIDAFSLDPRIISKATGGEVYQHYFALGFDDYSTTEAWYRMRLQTDGSTTNLDTIGSGLTTQSSAGTWRHLAAVYDGSDMIIYADGEEVARTGKTGTLDTSDSVSVWIGNNYPGGTQGDGRPWDGLIDEVMVFSRGLNAAEIQELHSRDLTPYK